MRWMAVLVVLPLLAACNLVTSPEPLFTPADTVGAPILRDGLWLSSGDGLGLGQSSDDCEVDVALPADQWPACVRWYVVERGQIRTFEKPEDGGQGEWTSEPFLLAAGQPAILQLDLRAAPVLKGILQSEGFLYQGVEPTGRDEAGRVIAFDAWFAYCGPPPDWDAKPSRERAGQTRKPFKGLKLHRHDPNCTASKASAVRSAAAASRALDMSSSDRWIRDTYP